MAGPVGEQQEGAVVVTHHHVVGAAVGQVGRGHRRHRLLVVRVGDKRARVQVVLAHQQLARPAAVAAVPQRV